MIQILILAISLSILIGASIITILARVDSTKLIRPDMSFRYDVAILVIFLWPLSFLVLLIWLLTWPARRLIAK
jgi:hypothetical protein